MSPRQNSHPCSPHGRSDTDVNYLARNVVTHFEMPTLRRFYMKTSIFSFPLKKTWQKGKKKKRIKKKRLGSAGPTFSSSHSQLELKSGCPLWAGHKAPGPCGPHPSPLSGLLLTATQAQLPLFIILEFCVSNKGNYFLKPCLSQKCKNDCCQA